MMNDNGRLTCDQKLLNQLNLPHGTKKKRICSEETVKSQESNKSVRERNSRSMVGRICERGSF